MFERIYAEVEKRTGKTMIVPHVFESGTAVNFAFLFENLWIAVITLLDHREDRRA